MTLIVVATENIRPALVNQCQQDASEARQGVESRAYEPRTMGSRRQYLECWGLHLMVGVLSFTHAHFMGSRGCGQSEQPALE